MGPEQLRELAESARKALGPSLDALQQTIQRSIAPMLEVQRQAIERSVAPLVQAQANTINTWVKSNQDFLGSLLRTAEMFRKAWQEAIPPNLRDLEADSFYEALQMSIEQGPCVMWAPQTEIVEDLVAGETFADRSAVLIERRDDILSDLTTVLAESTCEVLEQQGDARELAGLAVHAARHGHDAAAQALAAAALGCVLEEVLRYGGLGAVYKEMSVHDIEETEFGILRLVTIELATSRALVDTEDHVEGFNRHGTLHGKRAFYGAGEMISGLLLVVTWIRELSWWAEHEPSFLVDMA